jgi:hypothetical protein
MFESLNRHAKRHARKRARPRLASTPHPVSTPSQCPSRGTSFEKCLCFLLTRSSSCQVAIKSVSDEVLLNIFYYFLDVSPRDWPRLVHTCRKWRRIVFASQQALRLWLFCTHGTPVQKSLDCWPALPIAVRYGGSLALGPPAPEDEDNIMAALKQSDRVISIRLTITSSLLEKLSTIKAGFSKLQDVVLLSRDDVPLTLPISFRWGRHLRHLHSTGIVFPCLLQLLHSSTNLIDLRLHEVILPWTLSPEMLMNVVSKMTQLRSLSLHFRSTDNNHRYPPHFERVILPSLLRFLTRFNYGGSMAYFERIMARTDAPFLEDIEVTFFDDPTLTLSKLNKFIDQIEMHRSQHQAHILSSEPTLISISLTQPGASTRLKLQLLGMPLHINISSMARIRSRFPNVVFSVGELYISEMRHLGREDIFDRQWLELLDLFTGVKEFHVNADDSDLTNIVHALQLQKRRRDYVLPTLHKLCIQQPGPRHAPLREEVVRFMVSRRLSGHPIEVEYERLCDIKERTGTGTICAPCLRYA